MRLPILFLFSLILSCAGPDSNEESVSDSQKGEQPYVEVYDNGQPRIKGLLLNGKRDGLWVSFYENGVRWSEESYQGGTKNGQYITFYPSGIIRYRGYYIEDEKAGTWQFYDEEGRIEKEMDFNATNQQSPSPES